MQTASLLLQYVSIDELYVLTGLFRDLGKMGNSFDTYQQISAVRSVICVPYDKIHDLSPLDLSSTLLIPQRYFLGSLLAKQRYVGIFVVKP